MLKRKGFLVWDVVYLNKVIELRRRMYKNKVISTVYLDKEVFEVYDKVSRLADVRKSDLMQCALMIFFALVKCGKLPEEVVKIMKEDFNRFADLNTYFKVVDKFRELNLKSLDEVMKFSEEIKEEELR